MVDKQIKSIEATYVIKSIFDVDFDLEAVENIRIKWDTLFVDFKNGNYLEVVPCYKAMDNADLKFPIKEKLFNALDQEVSADE